MEISQRWWRPWLAIKSCIGRLYKKSTVPMSFVKKMVSTDIQSITKFVIEWEIVSASRWGLLIGYRPEYNTKGIPELLIAHGKNIQELHLSWAKCETHDLFTRRLVRGFGKCVPKLQTIRKLSVMFPCIQGWWSNPNHNPVVYEAVIDIYAR